MKANLYCCLDRASVTETKHKRMWHVLFFRGNIIKTFFISKVSVFSSIQSRFIYSNQKKCLLSVAMMAREFVQTDTFNRAIIRYVKKNVCATSQHLDAQVKLWRDFKKIHLKVTSWWCLSKDLPRGTIVEVNCKVKKRAAWQRYNVQILERRF